jgi:hypothetical protein
LLEDLEATRLVVRQCVGVIERPRVQPNAVRAHVPGSLRGLGQRETADAFADEARQQPE